jgi:hypothetical protein
VAADQRNQQMPEPREPAIDRLLEEHRREMCLREERLGPIVAAVGMLRESCATTRLLLDEIELSAGVHLELLDAVLSDRFGGRWWEDLAKTAEHDEEVPWCHWCLC